jgi:hypothetical protein
MTSAVIVAQGGNSNYTFRNRIINGAIGIWQRGTSFTSGGVGTYTADRFYGNGSSGTISRSTDVPAGFTYSFSNAASSTAYPGLAQRIESFNIADCASQAITVSFYAKQTSGTASAININLAYPTAVDNYASSTTIVETNVVATMSSSWTRYSYTYTLPANVTNGLSVTLFVPGASITATFLITGIQLEAGSTATPFENRPYGTELALCQRYFISYGGTTGYERFGVGMGNGATTVSICIALPVPMRVAPTLGYSAVGDIGIYDGANVLTATVLTLDQPSEKVLTVAVTVASGGTQYRPMALIATNNTVARLRFSAEL